MSGVLTTVHVYVLYGTYTVYHKGVYFWSSVVTLRLYCPPTQYTYSRTWWHALQVAAAEPVRERERGVEGLQRRDRLAVAYAQRAALLLEEQVAALGLGQRERDREAARAG